MKIHNCWYRTYKKCEIYPGPYLNLIYGPNGSGKSSIVCAICLGLGGKPGFLGRAKEISEYVMHGEKQATIEIELFTASDEKLVIVRKFECDKKHSTWLLNGSYVTEKKIIIAVSKYGININNLCQVLPQDRVADFSRMNSTELLIAVEKSIDNGYLFDMHRKLIDKYSSCVKLRKEYTERLNEVQKIEQKVKHLQEEMDKVKEHQDNIKTLSILEQKLEWMKYDELQLAVDKCRDDIEEKLDDLDKQKLKIDELEHNLRLNKNNIKQCSEYVLLKSLAISDYIKELKSYSLWIDNHLDKVQISKQGIIDLEKLALEREDTVKSLTQQIDALKCDLELAKKDINRESLKIVEDKIGEKLNIKKSFQQIFSELIPKKSHYENQLQNLQNNLSDLNDSTKQLLEYIRSLDIDTYKAVMWLKNHQHLFKEPIVEPLLLHINLNNMEYAKYLECHIPRRDFTIFLCHNKEDMVIFINEVRTKLNLRVSISPVDLNVPEHVYNPKSSALTYYKNFNIKCFLKDTFKTTKTILYYLCQTYNIHHVPIFPDMNDDQIEKLCNYNGLSCFYTENHKYVIKKSQYSQNKSVSVSFLKSNKMLSSRKCDEAQISIITTHINEIKQQLSQIDNQIEQQRTMLDKLNKEIKTLEDEKRIHQENELRVTQLESKLEAKQDRLDFFVKRNDLETDRVKYEENVTMTYKNLLDGIPRKLRVLECDADILATIDDILGKKLEMMYYYQQSEKIKLDISLNNDIYKRIKNEVDILKNEINALKTKLKIQLKNAQKLSNNSLIEHPDETMLQEFSNYPLNDEQLRQKINELKSIISCSVFTDTNVIESYQNNQTLLILLQNEVAEMKTLLDNVIADETVLADEWLLKINKIIDDLNVKFQDNFQRINCHGKIVLQKDKDGNYENYGIEIWVKYREEQSLSRLDSMRQSGGEKSVATMLFLMSLQHISHAPIRIVDEINQGMDEINERAMFKIMVDTLATLKNSQYFFLSPKSLPNLQYDPQMTILTIFNGPYLKNEYSSRKRSANDNAVM